MKKILWIASREFVATVFTKAFLIGLLFLPVMIAVVSFVFGLMDDDGFRPSGRIAILDPTGLVTAEARRVLDSNQMERQLAEELRESGGALAGAADVVETLEIGPDFTLMQLAAGTDIESEKQYLHEPPDAGGLLALVEVHPDAIESDVGVLGSYDIYVGPDIDERESSAVHSMLRDAIINLRIETYGFDRETVNRLMRIERGQSMTVTETEERETVGGLNVLLPIAFMFLLFMGIMGGGQMLMTSTIEEKSSRVVEVLLSAVSPMQLMTGKLLGHMSHSLLGMSIYLVVGLVALSSFSLLGLIDTTLVVYLFVFFFIAFFTVGSLMMAIGAAVNELREAQSLMMPFSILLMLPMFLWWPISRDPSSVLSVSASFIPPINTFGMLLRLASTEPPPAWQVWLSIAVGIVFVYVAIWCAARVFSIGLLLTGKPPNFRTLLRWIRAG
ncbi:MAG TPA: ABC transporter permease [Gammaproteobacteria bacterium]|nr:ABC transporter permease [Gammaproteobacteria bacterium]